MHYNIQRWDKVDKWVHVSWGGPNKEAAEARMKKLQQYAHLHPYILRVVPEIEKYGYKKGGDL